MNDMHTRLEQALAGVRGACLQAGRDPTEVQLIAVSKTRPATTVAEAALTGHRHFGENYAQELRDKVAALGNRPLFWQGTGRYYFCRLHRQSTRGSHGVG